MNKPRKIRIGVDLDPDLKRRLDTVVKWGLRNQVLEALIERLVERLENSRIGDDEEIE